MPAKLRREGLESEILKSAEHPNLMRTIRKDLLPFYLLTRYRGELPFNMDMHTLSPDRRQPRRECNINPNHCPHS